MASEVGPFLKPLAISVIGALCISVLLPMVAIMCNG
jgi:hypothetical protein